MVALPLVLQLNIYGNTAAWIYLDLDTVFCATQGDLFRPRVRGTAFILVCGRVSKTDEGAKTAVPTHRFPVSDGWCQRGREVAGFGLLAYPGGAARRRLPCEGEVGSLTLGAAMESAGLLVRGPTYSRSGMETLLMQHVGGAWC